MSETDLSTEYRKAVASLAYASEQIDNTKGVKQNSAKMDFIMAQNNVLGIQLMMLMEQLKENAKKEETEDDS